LTKYRIRPRLKTQISTILGDFREYLRLSQEVQIQIDSIIYDQSIMPDTTKRGIERRNKGATYKHLVLTWRLIDFPRQMLTELEAISRC